MGCYRKRSGFTLIELLVVIAIIAILAAILFPVFAAAKRNAQGTACISNLKQLSMAFREYNQAWNDRYMPALGLVGKGYPKLMQPYVRNKKIFLCPTAPKRLKDYWQWGATDTVATDYISHTQDDPNAPDCGWTFPDPGAVNREDWSRSNYGQNLAISGQDPAQLNKNREVWTHPALESDVREGSKVIYMTDSRWVDLYGGFHPGRIGNARIRHKNGANALCCDGHVRWLASDYLRAWVDGVGMPLNSNPRWDYR